MAKIKILSDHLKNIIAAGEVIERPANVVKELMENSLDADASFIEVEIERGGKTYILVSDDGEGMDEEDLYLAVERHATSKISAIEHLKEISSFGFRGEALPSIGAVAHLKICSVKKEMEFGHCLEVCFGDRGEIYPCPLRRGTRVEVRDLFLRTPARLKFLRSKGAEAKRCEDIFMKIALAHGDRGFSLRRDGREIYFLEQGQGLKTRLSNLWPSTLVEEMIKVEQSQRTYSITGLVTPPSLSQRRGNRILFYVNNRPIQDRLLMKALRSAYEGMLLGREFPAAVLFINVPPHEVDVNVHPSKEEIRFRDESSIFSFVHGAIKRTISSSYSPVFTTSSLSVRENSPSYEESNIFPKKEITSSESVSPFRGKHISFTSGASKISLGEFSYLGQILNSYLLVSLKDTSLMIVDQHAAHERVLYEKLYRAPLSSQSLTVPMVKKIPTGIEKELVTILKKAGFGFKIEHNDFILYSYPAILSSEEVMEVMEEVLSRQIEGIEEIYKLMACKRAIKAGTPLGEHEAMALLKEWFKVPNRNFCPHGRPTVIHMDSNVLEKMFKRRG